MLPEIHTMEKCYFLNPIIQIILFSVISGHSATPVESATHTTETKAQHCPMPNLTEHEIFYAHRYKNIKKFSFVKGQINLEYYLSCS